MHFSDFSASPTSFSFLLRRLGLAAACAAAATSAQASAGFQFLEIPAEGPAPALRGAVWYPCDAPPGQVQAGRVALTASKDCPAEGGPWPLVVISHGSGGSFLGHHDTAQALAEAGFVVAAVNHPGDSVQDLARQGEASIFETRPADMRRLVDHLLARWPAHAHIDAGRIGFFGFSRGGYTGLVAAGAVPDLRRGASFFCRQVPEAALCRQPVKAELAVRADPRIRAAVIVDPFNTFTPEGLKPVAVPVQLWASERGGDGVTPESVEALRRDLPVAPDYRVAAQAGHFGFMAPCPPALVEALPQVCRDAPPFDRAAFHKTFNAQVLDFFRAKLPPRP